MRFVVVLINEHDDDDLTTGHKEDHFACVLKVFMFACYVTYDEKRHLY